ncbi:1-(5-phosphoribosyl)-5-[(5-phosphoribosylamino)methylideneamino]imidazole-4-carboxamide isomerase [Candidatus Marinamargulisbacteria bacterium SCGC AG-410-N11]|nr:1-(5-phosphoribosyl)-5-[(5-phosphoribosylamino)methylideneamino]imidazole-4-carboxamide isomerase [Candidatus Marinamargulisbacteria bacterium SCGC AG-410-N11]
MFNVIPAIDLINGKVVRLTQGKYDQVDEYNITPSEIAKEYEKNGAKRIHIVDLDGAKDGSLCNLDTLKNIRSQVNCEIEVGGGIRNIETVETLFKLGIDYVILGSLLTKDTELAKTIIQKYPNKIIAGLDTKNLKIAIEGWEETSELPLTNMLKQLDSLPLNAIIHTDIARDGMLNGPNLDSLLYFANNSTHNIIASGGVSNINDITSIAKLETNQVIGVIVGKAILSGKIKLNTIPWTTTV